MLNNEYLMRKTQNHANEVAVKVSLFKKKSERYKKIREEKEKLRVANEQRQRAKLDTKNSKKEKK